MSDGRLLRLIISEAPYSENVIHSMILLHLGVVCMLRFGLAYCFKEMMLELRGFNFVNLHS